MAKKDFSQIAKFYNAVYFDKPYKEEVDDLINHFPDGTKKVLDVGCGTGRQSFLLYQKGYDVTGIDPSMEMLKIARLNIGGYDGVRSGKDGSALHLYQFKAQDYMKPATFQAVVAMFDVFDYILSSGDFRRALQNVRRSLTPHGVFFIEGWNKDRIGKVYQPYKLKKFMFQGKECKRTTLCVKEGQEDIYNVAFTYDVDGKKYQEVHKLHPRFGENNKWIEEKGFTILEQQTDEYSVKLWLQKKGVMNNVYTNIR